MENVLPKNWIEVQLIDLLEVFQTGVRPKGGVQGILEGIPSLGGEHLDPDGGFNFKSLRYIPVDFANGLKRGRIEKYDILIVKDGATTGKTSFVDENFPFAESYVNEHLFICRPNKLVNAKYLFYFMRSEKGQARIMSNFAGAAQGGINLKFASNTLISLPPIVEQEQIVSKLDGIFDQIAKIKDRIRKIDQLGQSLFESIFYNSTGTGKLSDHLTERKTRVGQDWDSYPKIGVSRKHGIIDLATGEKKNFDNYKVVKPGDFIYNTMRVNIGSIAIYDGKVDAITSPDYVVFSTNAISQYLLLNYLKSSNGSINISSVSKGSVRSRLYFKSLITIPFPFLTEQQHEFAEKSLLWMNKNIKRLKRMADFLNQNIAPSILEKACNGKLLAQVGSGGEGKTRDIS